MQTALKQVALKREKEYNALLAAVEAEAEAWKAETSERGSVNDINDVYTTSDVSNLKGILRRPESADRQCEEVAGCGSALAVLSGCSGDQVSKPSPEPVPTPMVCDRGRVDVKDVLPSHTTVVKRGVRSNLAPSELTYTNHQARRSTNVVQTYNSTQECRKNKHAIPHTSTSNSDTGGLRPLLQTESSVANNISQSGGAYPVVNQSCTGSSSLPTT